jgi:replication-associated recombination protein RarA
MATEGKPKKAQKEPTLTKLGYDRSTVSSAFQKELRAGHVEAAVYWGVHLAQSGGAGYAFKRLMVCAAEDVGLADVDVVTRVGQLYQAWKGCVEHSAGPWAVSLHHLVLGIVLVAEAPKSTQIEDLATWTLERLKAGERLEVLSRYEDAHTSAGKAAGRTWREWYVDRHTTCRIPVNRYTKLLWKLKPEWCPAEWRDDPSPSDASGGER